MRLDEPQQQLLVAAGDRVHEDAVLGDEIARLGTALLQRDEAPVGRGDTDAQVRGASFQQLRHARDTPAL